MDKRHCPRHPAGPGRDVTAAAMRTQGTAGPGPSKALDTRGPGAAPPPARPHYLACATPAGGCSLLPRRRAGRGRRRRPWPRPAGRRGGKARELTARARPAAPLQQAGQPPCPTGRRAQPRGLTSPRCHGCQSDGLASPSSRPCYM